MEMATCSFHSSSFTLPNPNSNPRTNLSSPLPLSKQLFGFSLPSSSTAKTTTLKLRTRNPKPFSTHPSIKCSVSEATEAATAERRRKLMRRSDIRNIAIVAHVDHGKTTLVDAMLRQSKVFRDNQFVQERIMDSNDIERERGITILSKNTSITYKDSKINIIDTPGHSDFGGEVERILNMVEGILLVVDSVEGPMPQTRFVLKKALEFGHAVVVVVNKIDRPSARPDFVINSTFELFIELNATDEQCDFQAIYASGIKGKAGLSADNLADDLGPLFESIMRCIPGPAIDKDGSLQMLATNIEYDEHKGRIAIGRLHAGILKKGMDVKVCTSEDSCRFARVSELFVYEKFSRVPAETGPRGALRMAQGIQAFVGVGGEWLADISKTANSSAGLPTQMQLGLLSPLYLRRLFERMGATYIKLGQFVASAPTLFPSEYVEEFQNCFDRTPAVPFVEIQAILRQELGKPIESVFEYVDPTPLASASIAQVHGARLRGSQEDVVIKILKPGIEDMLVADLNFVYIVARILEFLSPDISRASLVGIVKDIRESMLEEVDFYKEAANIESFRRYLEAMGLTRQATAPKVYHQCSTKRVLTMERLYGVPLTDLDTISSFVSSPETSLITALNVWFGSLLGCESFHADVHAGNLWLLRDGRIGFLDFGIVGRISPKTWAAMEVFLGSIATEEYESMASALVEMGATDTNVDSKAFARDLEKMFSSIKDLDTEVVIATAREPATNATAVSANLVVDERQMNALFLDVIQVSESYGLKFPREFALLLKQLLYFDRYTRLLAPNLNMLQDQRISIASNRRSNYRDNFR